MSRWGILFLHVFSVLSAINALWERVFVASTLGGETYLYFIQIQDKALGLGMVNRARRLQIAWGLLIPSGRTRFTNHQIIMSNELNVITAPVTQAESKPVQAPAATPALAATTPQPTTSIKKERGNKKVGGGFGGAQRAKL